MRFRIGYIRCMNVPVRGNVETCITDFNEEYSTSFQLTALELELAKAFHNHQLCEAETVFGFKDSEGNLTLGYTNYPEFGELEVAIEKEGTDWYEISPKNGSYFKQGNVKIKKQDFRLITER